MRKITKLRGVSCSWVHSRPSLASNLSWVSGEEDEHVTDRDAIHNVVFRCCNVCLNPFWAGWQGIWKRPTVLHLLLRAIEKHRRRCNDIAWAGGFTGVEGAPVSSVSAAKIHLSDVSVEEMVREVMQGSEGAETGSATHALRVAWVDAIRKCPP